jgi:ribokinase
MQVPKVVVVGSINMDLVVRSVDFPKPGETCCGHSFTQIHGGKGANQAVAAARLGAHVSMVGRVGGDAFGASLVSGLEQEGIHIGHVLTSSAVTSGIAVIHVDDRAQNCITVIAGANGIVTPQDVLDAESIIAAADVVLLQFEIPLTTVKTAIELAKRRRVRILLDPAPAQPDIDDGLLLVDVICPNETEAQALTGIAISSVEDGQAAAAELCRRGAALGIVTMGSQGVAYCAHGSAPRWQGPFEVNAVDSTAAGDAFAAALSIALAEGQPADSAIRFASAAGALATTRPGAQPAMPYREEVSRLALAAGRVSNTGG